MAVIIIVEGVVITKQMCVKHKSAFCKLVGCVIQKRNGPLCKRGVNDICEHTLSLSLSALYSVLRCFVVSSFMIDKNQVCSLKGIGLELQLIYYTKWAIYEKLREYSISPGNPHTKKIHIAHILCDNVATCLLSLEISNMERCDIRFFFFLRKAKNLKNIYLNFFSVFRALYVLVTYDH